MDNKRQPDSDQVTDGLYLVSNEEMKLLRRLRQLQAGAHLVIIQTDGGGVYSLTLLESGKVEKLRKTAG